MVKHIMNLCQEGRFGREDIYHSELFGSEVTFKGEGLH
jgi:hypothetical protein